MKENQNLKNQVEDLKTTLSINKDLLFKYISQQNKNIGVSYNVHNGSQNNLTDNKTVNTSSVSTAPTTNFFVEIQEENSRLSEKISKLFNEKTIIEKKQELEDRIIQDKEIIDKLGENQLIFENKLQEREYMIQHLRVELEKYYQNDVTTGKEIFLAEPDRTNLELYNELNYSREIVAKVTRMLNTEKSRALGLDQKINELEEKITNLKKGKKISKNMDKISILDYISSSEDENEEEDDDENYLQIDSPIVKLPDKIKIPKLGQVITNHNQNKSFSGTLSIPKLDLSTVNAKYHHPKNIQIAEIQHNKETNRSANEYIEKLKFQLKVCKSTIKVVKRKVEKYKRVIQVQKNTIVSLKNKNELLDLQLKKSTGSTYDELSNTKKDINNTSMNINMSVHYSEIEDDENDDDFNYVIREYNKSVVNTIY